MLILNAFFFKLIQNVYPFIYEIVQKNALQALDTKRPFQQLLKADPRVTKVLSAASLDVLFDLRHYLKHLDYLYRKVLPETDGHP